MKHSLRSLPLLALPLLACSSGGGTDDDGAGAGDCDDLLAGDLVITEVMANPAGEDRGFEYFEVYNASSAAIDMAGLTLVYALPDGSNEQTHAMGALTIEGGAYLALGTAEEDALPEYVDYGFANDLGSLRNAGALLAIRCGETEIDRMVYPSMEGDDGIAFILDGANAPDHIANDDVANFCPATASFAEGLFGSPGAANEPCNPVVAGTCTDEDGERATVPPGVGDLVISEFMVSPAEADATREWFEVYAADDVDLNGLVAGREPGEAELTVESTDCIRVNAGQYALFARSDVAAENGGLPTVTYEFNFALVEDRTLFIGIGDQVLDQITMAPAQDNASTALSPELLDPDENDAASAWAICQVPYGDGLNTGTPGAGNEACGGGGGDTCLDGGTPRAIVPPGPGDLRISELMPNPVGVNDSAGEWFELEVLADIDLNGLEIGETSDPYDPDPSLISANCLRFNAGSFVLFAPNDAAGMNGGLPTVDFPTTQNLGQGAAGDSLFIGHGGTVLDDISWAQADVPEGASLSRVPGGDVFCPGITPYGGFANFGTPRAANPDCP